MDWSACPHAALVSIIERLPLTQIAGTPHSCCLVCSSWAEAAPAAFSQAGGTLQLRNSDAASSLQLFLKRHGDHIQCVQFAGRYQVVVIDALPCKYLRQICLTCCTLQFGPYTSLTADLAAATGLKYLTLDNVILNTSPISSTEQLQQLLAALPNLKHLRLRKLQAQTGPPTVQLPNAAFQGMQQLTALEFAEGVGITPQSLQGLHTCAGLQHFSISMTPPSRRPGTATAAATIEAAAAVSEALLEQLQQLRALQILQLHAVALPASTAAPATDHTPFSALQELRVTGAQFPLELLHDMTQLQSLHLCPDRLKASELLLALRGLTSLTSLELHNAHTHRLVTHLGLVLCQKPLGWQYCVLVAV